MTTVYTTRAVRDVPYPHGLGNDRYPELKLGVKRLLGEHWSDPRANAKLFWTSEYQDLIRLHLKPYFDRNGDIVAVADDAAEAARANAAFGQTIPAEGYAAYQHYAADLPPATHDHPSAYTREVDGWIRHPPTLHGSPGEAALVVDDGCHRLSLLRSLVEPSAPDFPVLVRITQS